MGDAGSAGAHFDRAIQRRSLLNALAAAHERRWLPLKDALELLVLIAEKNDKLYPRAGTRWLERLLGERELEPGEVQLAVAAVAALQGRSSAQAVTVLRELVNRPLLSNERRIDSISDSRRQ